MWQVRDLSRLTGVSARTLHHYDAIGLLTPSCRQPNGYRLYAEKDLARLQQIVALKYLGFSLKQITEFLKVRGKMHEQLAAQEVILSKKIALLQEVKTAVVSVMTQFPANNTLSLEHTLKLIEVYRMNNSQDKAWLNTVMSSHVETQKILNDKVEGLVKSGKVNEKIDQAYSQLAPFIDRVSPIVGSDPRTNAARDVSEEWFALVQNVFANDLEIASFLQRRSAVAASALQDDIKKLAEWAIIVRICIALRYSWVAEESDKVFFEMVDFSTLTSSDELMANNRKQLALYDEVRSNLDNDPASEIGKELAQKWQDLMSELYQKTPILKRAVKQAFIDDKVPTGEKPVTDWLRSALVA